MAGFRGDEGIVFGVARSVKPRSKSASAGAKPGGFEAPVTIPYPLASDEYAVLVFWLKFQKFFANYLSNFGILWDVGAQFIEPRFSIGVAIRRRPYIFKRKLKFATTRFDFSTVETKNSLEPVRLRVLDWVWQ